MNNGDRAREDREAQLRIPGRRRLDWQGTTHGYPLATYSAAEPAAQGPAERAPSSLGNVDGVV